MLISIAFITFFYAGGSFTETTVRLSVINAEFSKPEVLTLIAWLIFAWFLFRYWVTHKGVFSKQFDNEFSLWQTNEYIRNYFCKKIGQEIVKDENEGYHINEIYWRGWCVHIKSVYAIYVQRNNDGRIGGTKQPSDINKYEKKECKLTDFKGWLLAIRATGECIVKFPSFSSYMIPYVLSVIAIIGGLNQYVF